MVYVSLRIELKSLHFHFDLGFLAHTDVVVSDSASPLHILEGAAEAAPRF